MDSVELTVRTGSTLVVTELTAEVADLADAIDRILPCADVYRHRHGSPGHGPGRCGCRSCRAEDDGH